MGKFQIRQTASGVKFDLVAANGQVVLSSEVYSSRAAVLKGIASVRLIAPAAGVENRTEEGFRAMPNPKFELYQDRAGQYRFRLKARNGKIVGVSEAYAHLIGAQHGIDSVRTNASEAETEG